MAMNKVPTLLLGLGGIGSSIVDAINKMLTPDMKNYVAAIGMDTNREDLKKLSIKYIQTSDERIVKDFLNEKLEYSEWFPDNEYVVNRGMLTGAGQIRAISRLAGVASEQNGKYIVLEEEIKRIRSHGGDKDNSQFNVFIVGSITGGTGAGLFLQTPYFIREYLKNENALDNIRIRGMFISADITKAVQPSTINRDAVMVNAYACMKELNAFYLAQDSDENIDVQLDYYKKSDIREKEKKIYAELIRKNPDIDEEVARKRAKNLASEGANIPYDAFYLIEGTDNGGSVGTAELDSVKAQIARMIYTILFTPVKASEDGTTDNLILQEMEGRGMNRYSSAGLCRVKYPYEQAKEYVTLRWVKDLVKEEWTLLDKKYAGEVKAAQDRKKEDPSVEIPPLAEKYMDLFEKESAGGPGCNLAYLKKEVFIEDPEDPNDVRTKAEDLLNAVDSHIVSLVSSTSTLNNAKNQCEAITDHLYDLDNADGEIARVGKALDKYQSLMEKFIKDNMIKVADDVFPTSKDILDLNKKNPLSFYQMLVDVHPISGRYLCYNMIKLLDEKIEEMNNGLRGIDLMEYKNEDFDDKKEGKQTAAQTLSSIKNKNIPVFNTAKKNLKVLAEKVMDSCSSMADTIEEYGIQKIKLETYKALKGRFAELAEYYGQFFAGIEEAIKVNEERITTLEKAFLEDGLGEINVYASKAAFEQIYSRYKRKAAFELPVATKEAIFNGLYHITCKVFEDTGEEYDEKQKRARMNEIRNLLDRMFSQSIVNNLKLIVEEKGKGTVDLTIKQAIENDMLLGEREIEISVDDDSDLNEEEKRRVAYASKLVYEAVGNATPMFTVKSKPDFTETIYVCVNPKAAELKEGKPNKAETKNRLIPTAEAETDFKPVCVLMEPEFSPYEIVCLKAKHKYSIEDITKYGQGSVYEKVYEERIDNLDHEPSVTGVDAFKTVVNPHLNQHWHQEGLIPALTPAARAKGHENTLKAFVYGLGMDKFEKRESEGRTGEFWHFRRGVRWELIRSCDKLIGKTYADLFNSIPFNRSMKNTILYEAAKMIENDVRTTDIEEDYRAVLNTVFIRDLTQEVKQEGEDNFFDILLSMRPFMEDKKWRELFDGLRYVLDEYLSKLLNNNIVLMRNAYEEIIDRILMFSKVGGKTEDDEDLTIAEKKLFENIKVMKRIGLY